ncbi:MAG TPA: hypothetical protein VFZ11_14330 [Gemmatimonadaceae bacterium]
MFLPATAPQPPTRRIAAPGHASPLLTAWPGVHIGSVEVRRVQGRRHPRVTFSACIDLGELLPVDVRVALVPPRGAGDTRERRMFSVQSYANGVFRFAASVNAALLRGSGAWIVRVAPAAELAAGADVRPVVRHIVPRLGARRDAPAQDGGALTE